MTGADGGPDHQPRWTRAGERGSSFGLRLVIACIRTIGDGPLVVLVAPIALYFVTFGGEARRASMDYLARLRHFVGQAPQAGLRDVYRHLYSFSAVILDRLTLWAGGVDDFEVILHGKEHMRPLLRERRGALMVGAHIGSFDVMRVIAREAGIPVNVLMYTVNAERFNRAIEQLDPGSKVRLIELDPNAVGTGIAVRRCIERGEFVAMLADRAVSTRRGRVCHAQFLGETAAFPQGPFALSSILGVPVLFIIALRRRRRVYDVYFEKIAEGRRVSPRERQAAIQEAVELYASRLEHYCSVAPYQWFNFYDFWAKP